MAVLPRRCAWAALLSSALVGPPSRAGDGLAERIPDTNVYDRDWIGWTWWGWADVELDGVPDLFAPGGATAILVYPSGATGPVRRIELGRCMWAASVYDPLRRLATGAADPGGIETTTPTELDPSVPIRLAVQYAATATHPTAETVEYDLDRSTLTPAARWADEVGAIPGYIGDIDGDGSPDLATGSGNSMYSMPYTGSHLIRQSSNGQVVQIPSDLDDPDNPFVFPVGDIDEDGFDDVVAVYRDDDPIYGYFTDPYAHTVRGHLALYRGSATGLLLDEPLWEINVDPSPAYTASTVTPGPWEPWEPGPWERAIGGSVFRIPDTDALAVTLMSEWNESVHAVDLAVLSGASTPTPFISSRVPVQPLPELLGEGEGSWGPGVRFEYDYPTMWVQPEDAAQYSFAVVERRGVQWYAFDPETLQFADAPFAAWAPWDLEAEGPLYAEPYWRAHPRDLEPFLATSHQTDGVTGIFGWSPVGGDDIIESIGVSETNPCAPYIPPQPEDTGLDGSGGPLGGEDPEGGRGLFGGACCGCNQGAGAGLPWVLGAFVTAGARRRRSRLAGHGDARGPFPRAETSGAR